MKLAMFVPSTLEALFRLPSIETVMTGDGRKQVCVAVVVGQ